LSTRQVLGRRRSLKDAHQQRPDICTICHWGIRGLEVLARFVLLDERARNNNEGIVQTTSSAVPSPV
jgi:hypothetical protein